MARLTYRSRSLRSSSLLKSSSDEKSRDVVESDDGDLTERLRSRTRSRANTNAETKTNHVLANKVTKSKGKQSKSIKPKQSQVIDSETEKSDDSDKPLKTIKGKKPTENCQKGKNRRQRKISSDVENVNPSKNEGKAKPKVTRSDKKRNKKDSEPVTLSSDEESKTEVKTGVEHGENDDKNVDAVDKKSVKKSKRKRKTESSHESEVDEESLSSEEESEEENSDDEDFNETDERNDDYNNGFDSDIPLTRRKSSRLKAKPNASEENNNNVDSENGKIEKDNDSDSDVPLKRKKTRKKRKSSGSSAHTTTDEASDDEPKPKRKRKRIKKVSESSEDEGKIEDTKNEKKDRKNIRKILSDKKVSEDTKFAAEDERERRKRIEEKQKLYNELFEVKEGVKLTELPLDFDEETKEILVQVDPILLKSMKPHQGRGIKFMWDACFESKKDYLEDKKPPGGAILAHCMGLGKTLQSIGLVHTVMTAFPGKLRCVLVLAPVNVVKNWVDEFHKWLKGPLSEDIEVYEISDERDNWDRADRLELWKKEGGVMIMGYDMFRNLTRENDKRFKKKQRAIFYETLLNPGPQMLLCDEGHILKNMKSALNVAINKISTKRRIILTGTPLQNNLSEYFAMVDFVKPALLGTYREFQNRFVNPIRNGQHKDSTERDVRIMKKRSFILCDLLKGCMQRLDYNVLVPFLQPKHEYVLCICLTEFQKKLYTFYLKTYAKAGQIGLDGKLEGGKKGGLFYDCQNLSRVWNHPYILRLAKTRADQQAMLEEDEFEDDDDEAGSLKDFVVDGSDEESEAKSTSEEAESSDEGSDNPKIKKAAPPKSSPKTATRSTAKTEELVTGLDQVKEEELAADKGWWEQFLDQDSEEPPDFQLKKISLGSKMVILMDILKEAETVGDKVLVFSQSLLSLDIIQDFLGTIDESNDNKAACKDDDIDSYLGSWQEGKDYYRMDGQTSGDTRKKWCDYFNKVSNHRMRLFLISTKAGGLGINLVAANRVIIFDASWNPAHDAQSIFRVYRFGQEKPVYIYRFLAKGTMEEKIYDRQVTKQSLSARVVDEQQIERHFSMNELTELYTYNDETEETRPVPKVPKDLLLADLLNKHGSLIWKYHDHDSLLENQVDENLTEEDRKAAWEEFENEKKGIRTYAPVPDMKQFNVNEALRGINPAFIQAQYRKQYPHLTDQQVVLATQAYIRQLRDKKIKEYQQQVINRSLNIINKPDTPEELARRQKLAAQKLAQQQYIKSIYPSSINQNKEATGNTMQQNTQAVQAAKIIANRNAKLLATQNNSGTAQQPIVVGRRKLGMKTKPRETITLSSDDDDDDDGLKAVGSEKPPIKKISSVNDDGDIIIEKTNLVKDKVSPKKPTANKDVVIDDAEKEVGQSVLDKSSVATNIDGDKITETETTIEKDLQKEKSTFNKELVIEREESVSETIDSVKSIKAASTNKSEEIKPSPEDKEIIID